MNTWLCPSSRWRSHTLAGGSRWVGYRHRGPQQWSLLRDFTHFPFLYGFLHINHKMIPDPISCTGALSYNSHSTPSTSPTPPPPQDPATQSSGSPSVERGAPWWGTGLKQPLTILSKSRSLARARAYRTVFSVEHSWDKRFQTKRLSAWPGLRKGQFDFRLVSPKDSKEPE